MEYSHRKRCRILPSTAYSAARFTWAGLFLYADAREFEIIYAVRLNWRNSLKDVSPRCLSNHISSTAEKLIDKPNRVRRAVRFIATDTLLTNYMYYGASRLHFAKKRCVLADYVEIVGAKIELEASRDESGIYQNFTCFTFWLAVTDANRDWLAILSHERLWSQEQICCFLNLKLYLLYLSQHHNPLCNTRWLKNKSCKSAPSESSASFGVFCSCQAYKSAARWMRFAWPSQPTVLRVIIPFEIRPRGSGVICRMCESYKFQNILLHNQRKKRDKTSSKSIQTIETA